jgi:hypothetical protein
MIGMIALSLARNWSHYIPLADLADQQELNTRNFQSVLPEQNKNTSSN